jgi:hypothetical protein
MGLPEDRVDPDIDEDYIESGSYMADDDGDGDGDDTKLDDDDDDINDDHNIEDDNDPFVGSREWN